MDPEKLSSKKLQNLKLHEFCFLHWQSYINEEVEKIIQLILKEAYIKGGKILKYEIEFPAEYNIYIIEALKKRLQVSSIYIQRRSLYIDWSL
jgi:hypothetical protein